MGIVVFAAGGRVFAQEIEHATIEWNLTSGTLQMRSGEWKVKERTLAALTTAARKAGVMNKAEVRVLTLADLRRALRSSGWQIVAGTRFSPGAGTALLRRVRHSETTMPYTHVLPDDTVGRSAFVFSD